MYFNTILKLDFIIQKYCEKYLQPNKDIKNLKQFNLF